MAFCKAITLAIGGPKAQAKVSKQFKVVTTKVGFLSVIFASVMQGKKK